MRLLLSYNERDGYRADWLPDLLPSPKMSLHKSEQIRAMIAADVEQDIASGWTVFSPGRLTRHFRLTRQITRLLGGVQTERIAVED